MDRRLTVTETPGTGNIRRSRCGLTTEIHSWPTVEPGPASGPPRGGPARRYDKLGAHFRATLDLVEMLDWLKICARQILTPDADLVVLVPGL